MGQSDGRLTELEFTILDGMADDYEDVEQLYLYANRRPAEENKADIQFPQLLIKVRFALRDLLDVIAEMIREGYIEAKYSNDEEIAPLLTIDFSALHHYWFGATQRGIEAWNAYRKATKD